MFHSGKECGLHSGNIVQSASDQADEEQKDLWPEGVEALSKDALGALADGPRDKDTIVTLYAPWCQYSQVRLEFRKEPNYNAFLLCGCKMFCNFCVWEFIS